MKKGWSVEITRKDGTTFLAASGNGLLPVVHHLRRHAVEVKRNLLPHFDCRVVPVQYSEPKVIREKPRKGKMGV